MKVMASCISILFSPVGLTMLVIVVGYWIGKIRVGKIRLQVAGVLMAAILIGALIEEIAPLEIGEESIVAFDESLQQSMQWLSSIGTALFVAVIGIQSGYQLRSAFKKQHLLFFVLGVFVVLVTALLTVVLGMVDKGIDASLLIGVFCGAMTSTPGLAAACEISFADMTAITLGYGNA